MAKKEIALGVERRNAEFHNNLPDIVPTDFTIVNQFVKETGVWTIIKIGDHQLMIDSGELLAIHNDAVKGVKGKKRIFVGDHLEPATKGEFLPNLKLGIKKGQLLIAA